MGVLSDVYKADKYVSQKKMDSAVTAYEDTVSAMEKAGIKGELVYKRQIMANYRIGYLQDIDSMSGNINSWELSLPHFRSVKSNGRVGGFYSHRAQGLYNTYKV